MISNSPRLVQLSNRDANDPPSFLERLVEEHAHDLTDADIPTIVQLLRSLHYIPGDRFYELLPEGFREKIEPQLALNAWRDRIDEALFVALTPLTKEQTQDIKSQLVRDVREAPDLTPMEREQLDTWLLFVGAQLSVLYDHTLQFARNRDEYIHQSWTKHAAKKRIRLHDPDSAAAARSKRDDEPGHRH